MSRRKGFFAAALVGALGLNGLAAGQETKQVIERNGVQYEETRRVVRREEWVPQIEERKQTVYRQQVSTEQRKIDRAYYVPVTEYRWEPVMRGRWNPFVEPYFEYRLTPYTRWELKTDTQTVAVPKPQVVPETQTVKVWVTKPRVVEQEFITRVEVPKPSNPAPPGDSGEAVARRPGISLQGIPRSDAGTQR